MHSFAPSWRTVIGISTVAKFSVVLIIGVY
jgi:hypothetical protein